MQYWLSNRKFISALRRVLRPLHPPLPHSQARHLLRCHPGCRVYKWVPKKTFRLLQKEASQMSFSLMTVLSTILVIVWLGFYVQIPGPSFCHQCWRQAGKGSKYFLINWTSAFWTTPFWTCKWNCDRAFDLDCSVLFSLEKLKLDVSKL